MVLPDHLDAQKHSLEILQRITATPEDDIPPLYVVVIRSSIREPLAFKGFTVPVVETLSEARLYPSYADAEAACTSPRMIPERLADWWTPTADTEPASTGGAGEDEPAPPIESMAVWPDDADDIDEPHTPYHPI